MPDSKRNRKGEKGNDAENRMGNETAINSGYKKLPDNEHPADESISTKGDTANPKYSRTTKRKEDIEKETNTNS
jgi:hypothetical protein